MEGKGVLSGVYDTRYSQLKYGDMRFGNLEEWY